MSWSWGATALRRKDICAAASRSADAAPVLQVLPQAKQVELGGHLVVLLVRGARLLRDGPPSQVRHKLLRHATVSAQRATRARRQAARARSLRCCSSPVGAFSSLSRSASR